MDEYIQVGKISSLHGVKGEVKVVPLTDDIRRYDELKEVYMGIDKELVKIKKVSYMKGQVAVKFEGVDSVKDAEKILNSFLWVRREEAKKADDAFFIFDIIGLEVYDVESNYIGKVKDVLQTGANDVYVVKDEEKEYLIPAVKSIVKSIDIAGKKMAIDPIEGLLE